MFRVHGVFLVAEVISWEGFLEAPRGWSLTGPVLPSVKQACAITTNGSLDSVGVREHGRVFSALHSS